MADAKELDGKGGQIQYISRRDGVQLSAFQEMVFLEPNFDQTTGQARGIERGLDFSHQVG